MKYPEFLELGNTQKNIFKNQIFFDELAIEFSFKNSGIRYVAVLALILAAIPELAKKRIAYFVGNNYLLSKPDLLPESFQDNTENLIKKFKEDFALSKQKNEFSTEKNLINSNIPLIQRKKISIENFDEDELEKVNTQKISSFAVEQELLKNIPSLKKFGKKDSHEKTNCITKRNFFLLKIDLKGGVLKVNFNHNQIFLLSGEGKIYKWELAETWRGKSNIILFTLFNYGIFFKKTLIDIQCGFGFCLALSKEKEVFGWGYGGNGELGMSKKVSMTPHPLKIEFFSKRKIIIEKISAGLNHCLAVSNDGRVFSWGSGNNFKLGTGTENDQFLPKEIEFDKEMKFEWGICGSEGTVLCDEHENLWAAGNNSHGKLGIITQSGIDQNYQNFHQLTKKNSKFSNILFLVLGERSSLSLNSEGMVFVFGAEDKLELEYGYDVELIEGLPYEIDVDILKGYVPIDCKKKDLDNLYLVKYKSQILKEIQNSFFVQ